MDIGSAPTLTDAVSAIRLVFKVPRLLGRPIKSDEARAVLDYNLRYRETNFLALARNAIYDNSASPYRKLLALAGCEYEDLKERVIKDGLPSALRALYHSGVYLTIDEFKGRRPVVRGNTTFKIEPRQFSNPAVRPDIVGKTGGSRGPGTPVPIDFSVYRGFAVNAFLDLEARGGLNWVHAIWQMPGNTALVRLLRLAWFQTPLDRWFSLVDPKTSPACIRATSGVPGC